MRLLERFGMLMKADAHGVLEQLEEGSLLAKQHLREAELELDRKRAHLGALAEELRRLEEESAHLEAEASSLDADVELALAGGKEELARFSARRLLPVRDAAQTARRRMDELRTEQGRLGGVLAEQEAQLESLRTRVRTRLAEVRAREGDLRTRNGPAADEEVELELLRRRAARGEAS